MQKKQLLILGALWSLVAVPAALYVLTAQTLKTIQDLETQKPATALAAKKLLPKSALEHIKPPQGLSAMISWKPVPGHALSKATWTLSGTLPTSELHALTDALAQPLPAFQGWSPVDLQLTTAQGATQIVLKMDRIATTTQEPAHD